MLVPLEVFKLWDLLWCLRSHRVCLKTPRNTVDSFISSLNVLLKYIPMPVSYLQHIFTFLLNSPTFFFFFYIHLGKLFRRGKRTLNVLCTCSFQSIAGKKCGQSLLSKKVSMIKNTSL